MDEDKVKKSVDKIKEEAGKIEGEIKPKVAKTRGDPTVSLY